VSSRRFALTLAAIVVLAALLRGLFPTADPPWRTTVGVVWHDEGAWTHNARNRALWGTWVTDNWNPMYIAPVFTGLEYAAFSAFGVGLWQARTVSMAAGVLSVWLLGLAVARLGGRTAGLIAAGLLATNYVWVMYSRAALMEATMVAFMVASFCSAVRAQDRPAWGLAAGPLALLAYFTKAAAASYVAALGLVALVSLVEAGWRLRTTRTGDAWPLRNTEGRAALAILVGLALGGAIALAVFVLPNWAEYRFYNWQMSVTRKPSYTVKALLDRLSWFPVVHDVFTRMWFVVLVASVALAGWLARLRETTAAERLLAAWIGLGALQLVLHDVGNERRFVYLIPALVAVAALALGRDGRLLPAGVASLSSGRRLAALPVVLAGAYLVCGGLVRLAFLYDIGPSVRWSALAAVVLTAVLYATWRRVARLLAARAIGATAALAIAAAVMAGDLAQYGQYVAGITFRNIAAMRLVAERLPPGTLVHGKLANGLALESRIRPVFVGNHFGNYDDRLARDDARYVLTYVSPYVGYEGPVIREVLDAYPAKRLLWTVPVAESAGGADLAALFLKQPPEGAAIISASSPQTRAQD
jgi:4-amino-4-deoxy-L-arabinose transferase-like glycosyltransferase